MGDGEPVAFFAPGRVNLLGAHLDYNEGFVLPMAVDRGTYVLARPRDDGRVRVESLDRGPAVETSLGGLAFVPSRGWANYALGALASVASDLPGLDLLFAGDLPIGAGLSSSASILVATLTAANGFLQRRLSTADIVERAHRAEVSFVGVKCGIMDPYASAFGERDHVLHLDCREQRHVTVPFDSERAAILVCDTSMRRELSDGRFNDRVRECADALAALRALGVTARALRDVAPGDLERLGPRLDPVLRRRAGHIVGEIERTAAGAEALRRGDLEAFGRALRESHESCKTAYEVSSRELDALIEAANAVEGTYGARLTGAGFGGCCVAVVRRDAVPRFLSDVPRAYERSLGLRAEVHAFRPSGGAGRVALTTTPV